MSEILLDECSHSDIDMEDDVLPRMEEIAYNSHSTLYLFTSPQKLSNSLVIRNAPMKSNSSRTNPMLVHLSSLTSIKNVQNVRKQ